MNMALENEARFRLPEVKYEQTIRHLNESKVLALFELIPKGQKVQSDTYFDINGDLRRRGWSLRIRLSGKEVRATLKTPVTKDDAAYGDMNEELENSNNSELIDTLTKIVRRLSAEGVIKNLANDLDSRLLIKGIYPTLRELGLQDIFTVKTNRYRWIASKDSVDLAELALDDSHYDVGVPGLGAGIRECRIEVELLDASQEQTMTAICNDLMSRLDISEVRDSKFERGMLHFDTRGLREKLEVKIRLGRDSDYTIVLDRIENDPMFVPRHIFTRMPERVISDIYFDNAGQSLFQAGHYLRLRREGPARELVFRRLTQAARYGHVLQEEVVAKGEGEAFLRSWHLIQRWLSGAIGRPITGDIRGVDEAQNFLSGAGFHPMLEVEVERVPWIVERIDESSSYGAAPHHVAKLKYDQITMRDPDNRGHIIHATEFEATGVESDSASPQGRNRLGYEAFVPAFEEACGYHTLGKKTEHILFAKYFQGMIELGIAKSDPPWNKDQRLRYNVSLFREEPHDDDDTYDLVQLVQQEPGDPFNGSNYARKIVESIIEELSGLLRDESGSSAATLAAFLSRRLKDSDEAIVKSVVNVTVSQDQAALSNASAMVDMDMLARELSVMASEARREKTLTAEQIAAIEAAHVAAQTRDEAAVIRNLRKVVTVAAGLARQVGAPVVTAFIDARFGLK
jgi:adenylate cyclase class IV